MRHIAMASIALVLLLIIPLSEANARRAARGAVMGGLTGAAIGGIAGGGRGAAIGGLVGLGVGSVMGSQADRRRGNYYWYNGRCWIRFRNGEFHPVSHRYCR